MHYEMYWSLNIPFLKGEEEKGMVGVWLSISKGFFVIASRTWCSRSAGVNCGAEVLSYKVSLVCFTWDWVWFLFDQPSCCCMCGRGWHGSVSYVCFPVWRVPDLCLAWRFALLCSERNLVTQLQTQLMPSWLQQEGLLQSHASAPDKNTKCFWDLSVS